MAKNTKKAPTKKTSSKPRKTRAKKTPAKKTFGMPGSVPTTENTNGGTVIGGSDPCTCGHSPEEHGRDAKYPGSTSCSSCEEGDCIAYEADPLLASD